MIKRQAELEYKEILKNEEVREFLRKGNENLGVLGYTDHSEKHCAIVAKRAGMILSKLGYSGHAELLGTRFKLTANGSRVL